MGSPEALGAGRPRGYFPATGEGAEKTRAPSRKRRKGTGAGAGMRTVQKDCGHRKGL